MIMLDKEIDCFISQSCIWIYWYVLLAYWYMVNLWEHGKITKVQRTIHDLETETLISKKKKTEDEEKNIYMYLFQKSLIRFNKPSFPLRSCMKIKKSSSSSSTHIKKLISSWKFDLKLIKRKFKKYRERQRRTDDSGSWQERRCLWLRDETAIDEQDFIKLKPQENKTIFLYKEIERKKTKERGKRNGRRRKKANEWWWFVCKQLSGCDGAGTVCDEDSGGSWLPFSIFIFNKQNYTLRLFLF